MKSKEQAFKKQPLSEFLGERITNKEYEGLYPRVFKTPNRKTFVFNNPEKANYDEVYSMAIVADVTPKELMKNTRMGVDKVTYSELEELAFDF